MYKITLTYIIKAYKFSGIVTCFTETENDNLYTNFCCIPVKSIYETMIVLIV